MTFEDALDLVYGEDAPLIGKTVTIDGDEWTVDAFGPGAAPTTSTSPAATTASCAPRPSCGGASN